MWLHWDDKKKLTKIKCNDLRMIWYAVYVIQKHVQKANGPFWKTVLNCIDAESKKASECFCYCCVMLLLIFSLSFEYEFYCLCLDSPPSNGDISLSLSLSSTLHTKIMLNGKLHYYNFLSVIFFVPAKRYSFNYNNYYERGVHKKWVQKIIFFLQRYSS